LRKNNRHDNFIAMLYKISNQSKSIKYMMVWSQQFLQ